MALIALAREWQDPGVNARSAALRPARRRRGRSLVEPEILTERLQLSRLTVSDAPAMFGYRADPEVCRFQSFQPRTRRDVEEFIDRLGSIAFDVPGSWFQFGIRSRESGMLIGDIGTHFLADDPRQVEIGFTLAPAHQRRGFATEAVAGVLDHLLVRIHKHRVFASVDPRNAPSIALVERVGMRLEAHFRESLWFKGQWVDDMVFGILASEWRGGLTDTGGGSEL
jgi:RimJ/RimL family protein N-acetyltransferase